MLFPLQTFSKAAGLVQDQNQSSSIGHLILWRDTHVFYPLHGFLLLSACSLRLSPLAHVFMTPSTFIPCPSKLWPVYDPKGLSSSLPLHVYIFALFWVFSVNSLFILQFTLPREPDCPCLSCHALPKLRGDRLASVHSKDKATWQKIRHVDHTLTQALSRIVPLKSDMLRQVYQKEFHAQ